MRTFANLQPAVSVLERGVLAAREPLGDAMPPVKRGAGGPAVCRVCIGMLAVRLRVRPAHPEQRWGLSCVRYPPANGRREEEGEIV